ncbi:MAG TPA: hypothetical protein VM577_14735 [Anaerovoracaceae bacterium]|nr:hypothetical protein [Anaerovoracaceae bacterium]
MSSIVKAKLLTYAPLKPMDYSNAAQETDSAEIEKTSVSDVNEKKEAILRQALKKANHIENEAKLRADALVGSALKSSREIMNTAEKKGYDEGYLRGLVDGANASENAAEEGLLELRRLIDLFKTEQKIALERDEKDLMEIAFELAGKIMKQHVQADENAVQKMLEEIVLENEGRLKIYFSEYQKTLGIHIDKAIAKKMRNLTKEAKLIMIKEEDLIMSENEGGIVDMSVPVQLEQLKKAVDHAY